MILDKTILQYQISDWHQLTKCQSNNCPELKIKVSDFIQNKDIEGTKVEIWHPCFGTLFAYTIEPKGQLITEICCDCDAEYIMHSQTLLNELRRYGFYVDFKEENHLQSGQLRLLKSLVGLKFDKLRLISVHEDNDKLSLTNYICVFNILENPNWINPGYSPSQKEWETALTNGTAFNVTGLDEAQKYNWSWAYNAVYDLYSIIESNESDG